MKNIACDLQRYAAAQPDAVLYTFLDGAGRIVDSYTYQRFDQRTNFVAAALHDSGRIAAGDRVLLVFPPGLDFIVAFFACAKLGAVPVPVPPPDASGLVGGIERLSYVAADAGVSVALTTDAYLGQLRALAARSEDAARWLEAAPLKAIEWVAITPLDGGLDAFDVRANPLLFLQYTSGSTQTPRGVMVSHDNVRHNCTATMTHSPTAVSWLPHYHDMGLIGYYLFVLLTGGSMYGFAGAQFLKRPLLWLETISKFRGTITSAPNFAFEYCLREDKAPTARLAGLDLSSMVCMMNASEPVRATTYRRFLERFGPYGLSPKSSVVFYGLAENTLSVSGNGRFQLTVNTALLERKQLRIEAPRPDRSNQSLVASCGQPLAGIDVRIVDPTTATPLREGGIGEVWVGGASKTLGYWNNPAVNRAWFEATLDGEPDGASYLRTGDTGFLHEGELFICGRLKDLVIIGGRNYYPADIEAVVERVAPKVRLGCVAAFAVHRRDEGEGMVVIAEPRRPNDLPDLEAIWRAVRRHCHVDLDVLALVPHGTIIKTSSGKISRQACRRAWDTGVIPVIASRVRAERTVASSPLQELLEQFAIEDDQRTLADLGVDSLMMVDLSLHLEGLWKAGRRSIEEQPDDALFDLRVLHAATLGELRAFVAEASAGTVLPDLARDLYLMRQAEIDREQTQMMREDARLPATVRPAPGRVEPAGSVLLTGATGFLGAFLLEALLRLTDLEIVTLARGEDDDHARTRVEIALGRTDLLDHGLREQFDARVRVLNGDLSLPRLGLTDHGWQRLGNTVSGIYHCGAEVDYVKPYEQLRPANVGATLSLLQLAALGRPKALHYVSTTFMFGFVARDVCAETDSNAEMGGLNFGYSQTKWVSEQLVLEAIGRGLNGRIYRPSLLSASRTGRYAKGDLMARIFSYMIRHNLSIDSANQLSLLPVDVCANNIVALSCLPEPGPTVFHLTADAFYTMEAACTAINAHYGYPFEYISLESFIDHMNTHCTRQDLLFPLMAFFNQNYRRILSMRDKRYDNRQYRQERQRCAAVLAEPPLVNVVGQIVEFLHQEQLVPAPPARIVGAV